MIKDFYLKPNNSQEYVQFQEEAFKRGYSWGRDDRRNTDLYKEQGCFLLHCWPEKRLTISKID